MLLRKIVATAGITVAITVPVAGIAAPAAQAHQTGFCFGPANPDPLVCASLGSGYQVEQTQIGWLYPICYGLGCTPEMPIVAPVVTWDEPPSVHTH